MKKYNGSMFDYKSDVARNFCQSFATAVRNVVDPDDPGTEFYLKQLAPRLEAATDAAVRAGWTSDELSAVLNREIGQQLELIFSGQLQSIRDSIKTSTEPSQ